MKRLMIFIDRHIRAGLLESLSATFRLVLAGVLPALLLMAGCETKMGPEIAALVNDRPIPMSELDAAIRTWPGDETENGGDDAAARRKVLEQLIEEELIVAATEGSGPSAVEAELEEQIKEIRSDFPDDSFEEMLVRNYVSYEAWKEKLRRMLLVRHATEAEIRRRVKLDPREWEEFYEKNRDVPPVPGRVKVRHITAATRLQAEKALKFLSSGGDWDKAVRETMDGEDDFDPGQAVWARPDLLPPALGEAIAKTPVGRVSDIIDVEGFFVIFQVVEAEAPEAPAPEVVLDRIRRLYQSEKEAEAYAQWLAELKEHAEIVINPALSFESEAGREKTE